MKTLQSLIHRVLPLSVVLLVASAAGAQTYLMSGKFGSSRGGTVDIPAIGNTTCASLVLGQRTLATTTMMLPQTVTPGPTRITPAQPFGCIAGGPAVVTTTGMGMGGQLTIPSGFFSKPQPPTTMPASVSVPLAPQVQQLATTFGVVGPVTPQTTPNMGLLMTGGNTAVPRVFRTMAYLTQTGRVGPNFTWCPGAGTACTNIASAAAGSELIIKYTGGANTFGGTMAIVLSSAGNSNLGLVGITVLPPGAVGFNILGGMGSQPTGKGYINLSTDALASGPVWGAYATAAVYNPTLMVSFNLVTSVSMFFGNLLPADTNRNYGFPFTTGTVLARNTGTALGTGVINTLTGMGTDVVTSMGARNISLVAGAVAHTVTGGTNTGTISSMALNLPEPGAAAQVAVAVVGLLGVAAWRARRSR